MTLASTRTRRFLALQVFFLAAALSACGGSGGASNPADPPAPPAAAVTAPTITAQPQDLSVPEGLSASFNVTASGSGALSYQWQRAGADLAGATSTTLSLGAASTTDDQAAYSVRVSNAAGSVFSRTATLSVQAAMGNTLALLAGSIPSGGPATGSEGPVDGTGAGASFGVVTSMTSDGTGNVYLTEFGSVRKITPAGVVTKVGSGSGGFYSPRGIVLANDGSLYVADGPYHVIRRVGAQGEVSVWAGSSDAQGATDGPLDQARFGVPMALARDRAGNIYVLDGSQNSCFFEKGVTAPFPLYSSFTVRKISTAGLVTTLPNASVSTSTALLLPSAIAVDADDNVYVSVTEKPPQPGFGGCDFWREPATAAYIQKITPAGQVTVFAGSKSQGGAVDGAAADARFKWPSQLAFDSRGALLVADTDNQAVRRIDANGRVTTPIGQLAATPATAFILGTLPGQLRPVTALAVLPTDTVVLSSGANNAQLVLRTERR